MYLIYDPCRRDIWDFYKNIENFDVVISSDELNDDKYVEIKAVEGDDLLKNTFQCMKLML